MAILCIAGTMWQTHDVASSISHLSVASQTLTDKPYKGGMLVASTPSATKQRATGLNRVYQETYVSAKTGDDHIGCGTQSDPCASIAFGISQTNFGGTVHVAQGTYTENLILDTPVDLLGGYSTDWATRVVREHGTTVDGNDDGAVLTIDCECDPLIEGFTFVNGNHIDHAGGGIRLVGGAAPTLHLNWILSNAADLSGGGIYVGDLGTLAPTIINNTIIGNTAGSSDGGGGGIYVKDRPALIQGNAIIGNQAENNDGGGIYLTGDTTAQVLGNWILSNEAHDDGGGVLIRSSGVYLSNNVIAENHANSEGSGLHIHGSSPRLVHNTIVRNNGGDGSGVHITDWKDEGTYSNVVMTNTILASQQVGVCVTASNTATLEATLWGTNTWANDLDWGCGGRIITGTVNVRGDPAFVAAEAKDYHIGFHSAAIDRGVLAGIPTDIDGDPRPLGSGPDIGADELPRTFLPLVFKRWPPIPEPPVLEPIDNLDGDGSYQICWSDVNAADYYVMKESTTIGVTEIYTVTDRCYTISGKGSSRYYYHVQACNTWGCSSRSNEEWVDVLWEREPNNSCYEANGPLVSGISYYGYPNDSWDCFSIYLQTNGRITAGLIDHTGNRVQLQLRDLGCDLEHYDYTPPYYIEHTASAGQHFVCIFSESGHNATQRYTLRTTFP